MPKSKHKITLTSVLVGILLVLGSYQNCALHQSDGRKQLDLLLSRQNVASVPSCLPYLAKYDADIIFDDDTITKLDGSTGAALCTVSGTDELFGAGIAVCTLRQDPKFQVLPTGIAASNGWSVYNNKVYYYKSVSEYVEKIIGDATPAVPNGEEKYYGVAVQNGNFINYHFIGATVELGIECRFSVDKNQFDADPAFRQELTKRGAGLIHKLREVCIDNANCTF